MIKVCKKQHQYSDDNKSCPKCRNESNLIWYAKNKENAIKKSLARYHNNRDEINEQRKIQRSNRTPEKIRKTYDRKNAYRKKKYKEDINFAIGIKLRIRLKRAIKSKLDKNDILLGCSIEEFKTHLESKFLTGMTWDNYGKWEIDHLKPLTDFNLSEQDQLLNACNYSNLRPSWKKLNRSKSNKKLIYLVTGVPGAGKSWVLSQLDKNKYELLDSDKMNMAAILTAIKTTDRIPVIALTIGISTFIKNNKDLHCQLLIINEDINTLEKRIIARGGVVTPTIEKRHKRMQSLAKKAIISGTSDVILTYLSN